MDTREVYMSKSLTSLVALLVVTLVMGVSLNMAWADGTETLGPPSISIASGSGIVAGGTGLETQPNTINVTVPAGSTINQVLLYWGDRFENGLSGDDTVTVGGFPVAGTLIGGPTPAAFSLDGTGKVSTGYRADITALGLIGPGANSVTFEDFDIDGDEDGAGILVIFDDGSGAGIQLVDGSDYANSGLHPNPASVRNHTEPQTFVFRPKALIAWPHWF
jgi:hypothetical protein